MGAENREPPLAAEPDIRRRHATVGERDASRFAPSDRRRSYRADVPETRVERVFFGLGVGLIIAIAALIVFARSGDSATTQSINDATTIDSTRTRPNTHSDDEEGVGRGRHADLTDPTELTRPARVTRPPGSVD